MTTFWRNGFWRTSVNGVPHWVEGHMVDRYAWDRAGYSHSNGTSLYRTLLRDARAARGFTSIFVNPNANCPVCGAQVFFYQNEHGSRVFFDELGPPWPKHPCTDNIQSTGAIVSGATGPTAPPIRSDEEASLVQQWLQSAALDPKQDFISSYKLSPWAAYRIEGRFGRRHNSMVVLGRLSQERPRRIYVSVKGLTSVPMGTLVFYYKGHISFFDESDLRPVEVEVERLHSATQFIDQLLATSMRSGVS
jgi:hypothetical protein